MQAASSKEVIVHTNETLKDKRGINANTIKIIAIIAMLIDHLTGDYITTRSLQGQLLHGIGRITAPIMSFFIVEGFYHTRNLKKYVMRLFIFSIISYFAFQFHCRGEFFYGFRVGNLNAVLDNSVIFTLLLGLLTLIVWFKTNWPKWVKIVCVILLSVVAIRSDWACIVVLWVFYMGINHGDFKAQMISLAVVGLIGNGSRILMELISGSPNWWQNLCQLCVVFAIPVLYLYNGKLGKSKNMKWLFYIFYPLHLLILGYMYYYL